MIIAIDARKAFDKIEHLFIIKSHNKLEIEGKFLNLKKGTYQNSIANSIFNGKNSIFSLTLGTRHGSPL